MRTRIGINVESTGRFRTRDQAAPHLKAGGRLAKLVARQLTRNR
jgi:hypothetical protein